MKKLVLSLMFALPVLFAAAQTDSTEWKEKKAFHEVMSQTYHPAEEGKLEPIKTRSGEMVDKAKAWQKSTPPLGLDKPEIKKGLDDLVKGSKELDKMIRKGASDEDIKAKLTSLHDVFHTIVGLCADTK